MFAFFLAFLLFCGRLLAAPVPVLDLRGSVNPGSADYLVRGIEQANADGAPAVLLRVDTPGGLVTSAREIVQAELGSGIPVIVWVSPSGSRAGSAGVFITLAAHVAAMAPGTTIGAAHPVDLFGGFSAPGQAEPSEKAAEQAEVMAEKILEDTTAWVRSIAVQRGRNVEWAERAVTESDALTDGEALENGVVDLVCQDMDALLAALHGRTVDLPSGPVVLDTSGWEPAPVPMTTRQAAVHFLSDPNLLFVLLVLGLAGLYVEFQKPGLIFPAAVGISSLLLLGVGLSLIPFNLGGLLLVLTAFVFFALEIWIPSYGLLTASGTLALVLGGLLLFDVKDFDLRVDLSTLLPVAGFVVLLAALVATLIFRSHRRRVVTGAEALVGAAAIVTSGGRDGGWVRLEGEMWKARWSGSLEVGTRVRVQRVDRLCLDVVPESPHPGVTP